MEFILHGVRGDIATPSSAMSRYGGNTSCVKVQTDSGALIFLDAGTGLHEAGSNLPDTGVAHVFITHGHADHTVGLWHFKPLHTPDWITHLYVPHWLEDLPAIMYRSGLFQGPFDQIRGMVILHFVEEGDSIAIDGHSGVRVEVLGSNHPGGALAFRVHADGIILAYSGDHEITSEPRVIGLTEAMLRGADIAIVDAQFSRATYVPGAGHSAWEDWVDLAKRLGLGTLVLSHHDPGYSDRHLQKRDNALQAGLISGKPNVILAREGMHFVAERNEADEVRRHVEGPVVFRVRAAEDGMVRLREFLEKISEYTDQSAILDSILTESRRISQAEAGTIYLIEEGELVFAYTHNDRLFSATDSHKHAYAARRMPLSDTSIAGYVASTGRPLNLANVYQLPQGVPYLFNDAFDRQTGFVTSSMLTLPFLGKNGNVLGVLQLVNSISRTESSPVPFTSDMVDACQLLAREASKVLEQNALERNSILSILRVIEVHDPDETAQHAKRVGDITAEIYHAWALRQGHDIDDIRYKKGHLRLAAMLHDVGKVGVPESILKKPGTLTPEEYNRVQRHPDQGAAILTGLPGEIATIAHDIALHHHQKWDGSGYSNSDGDQKLSGEEIPLCARIAAIADVFDALLKPRSYKPAWAFDAVMKEIHEKSGIQFDPLLVECVKEIEDVLRTMYQHH